MIRARHLVPLCTIGLALALGAIVPLRAAERASADEARSMVGKGVAYVRANGSAMGYAAISDPGGPFRDRDLYLVVYGLDGVVHAHGANPKMIGRKLIDLRDADGKAFVKERVDLGRTKSAFWQDYKFTHPVTKKVAPKRMYCETLDATVVCGGIYAE